jgi:hypothetical protein
MHGRDAVVEEVLDWRPYDYWTTRNTLPMPGAPKLVMTDRLLPLPDGGTRVEVRIGRPRPRERATFEQLYPMMEPIIHETGAALRAALEAEHARLTAAAAGEPPEAAVPASAGRHLAEPEPSRGRTVDSEDLRSSSG